MSFFPVGFFFVGRFQYDQEPKYATSNERFSFHCDFYTVQNIDNETTIRNSFAIQRNAIKEENLLESNNSNEKEWEQKRREKKIWKIIN